MSISSEIHRRRDRSRQLRSAGGDDPNNTEETKQLYFRSQARLSLFDDLWEQKLGFSLSDHDRKYHNDKDADTPTTWTGVPMGTDIQVRLQHNLYLHRTNILTLGVEHEEEEGKSEYYSESAWGPYSSPFESRPRERQVTTCRTRSVCGTPGSPPWAPWTTTTGSERRKPGASRPLI